MKPSVGLDEQGFMKMLDQCNSKIIIIKTNTEKNFLDFLHIRKQVYQGYTYVIEDDAYYYVTRSKSPISIPDDREVIHAKNVVF